MGETPDAMPNNRKDQQTVCHQSSETPTSPQRQVNYARLLDYYRVDPAAQSTPTDPTGQFALAMIESREDTSDNTLFTAESFADACSLAGEEVLDSGRVPDAVYDLDSGQRIELHTSTPIVTRSEDQGIMVNPLDSTDGKQAGERS